MALTLKSLGSFKQERSFHFKTFMLLVIFAFSIACNTRPLTAPPPASDEEEPEARTEFTSRLENFFEYEPLKAGKSSQFLIHLTDLADGAPVEKAEVTLTVQAKGSPVESARTTARIGKVTGIYVANLQLAKPGTYDITFHIKNTKLDELLPLTDFKVE